MMTTTRLSPRELVYLGCNLIDDLKCVDVDPVMALALDHVSAMRELPNAQLAISAVFDVLLSMVDVYGDVLSGQDLKAIAAVCVITAESLGGDLHVA